MMDLVTTVHIHVHMHGSDDRLEEILALLKQSKQRELDMAADLSALTTEVEEAAGVQQSAVTLLEGLAQAVRDAGTDPAALAALASQLDASTAALAAAVEANALPPAEPPV